MKAKMEEDLEKIEKAARNIVGLFDDKQLGLSTWHMFLFEKMKVIHDVYRSSNGLDEEKI